MRSLKQDDAPASFFYIGSQALFHPNIVVDAERDGFTIGNHSFSHSDNVEQSENRLSLELHATEYLISRLTGHASFYYRPPYLNGIGVDPTTNPYVPVPKEIVWVMQNGYNPVGSDIDPEDWRAY
jgi:peptidoglycan/xylan/chitin deacetylase (PgdA/CDA1 family)